MKKVKTVLTMTIAALILSTGCRAILDDDPHAENDSVTINADNGSTVYQNSTIPEEEEETE